MFEAESGTSQVRHPLAVLAEIEERGTLDQEVLLRDSATPWADLLADYADALTALAAAAPGGDAGASGIPEIPVYGLDAGHAGGCG
ncbi:MULTISPECIES: DUF6269 family protein [unclassified Streptomyces]|uniref:DUF6269 family protein n=1 Tax=unclassified Streptomyces TaxID=2593676 RepID=UPI001C0D9ECA|nr:DUF6269 family protein [Streptomyces sp. YPW6]QWQ42905.1 hypothetical protein KME66_19380 [Streptomyces sp. YPW6]